ncbi:hypothetical protein QJS66_12440 [Kocuria rhizophila]|nr:hypothetical protein QJS66_12440 [Kocuria rhizophila]
MSCGSRGWSPSACWWWNAGLRFCWHRPGGESLEAELEILDRLRGGVVITAAWMVLRVVARAARSHPRAAGPPGRRC